MVSGSKLTRKNILEMFADVIDVLPCRAYEIDNDYTLSLALVLGDTDDTVLTINFGKDSCMELNLMKLEQHSRVQAFLMDEPRDRIRKTKLYKSADTKELLAYFNDYLKEYGVEAEGIEKTIPLKAVISKYFNEKYTYIYFDPTDGGFFINNPDESGYVELQEGELVIV